MKKISVLLLAIMMLFAFTACDDASGLKEMNVSVRLGQHVRGESEDGGNWKHAIISMEGNTITVTTNTSQLKTYASTVSDNGEAMWLALLIDTGISDLENVVYNGTPLGEAGANEYKDLKGVDGVEGKSSEMVLWIKADDSTTYANGREITLSADGYIETKLNIKVVDDKTSSYVADKAGFDEAFNSAEDGAKIVLTQSIPDGDGVIFPADKFTTEGITIDLNGFTYSAKQNPAGSAGTKTQAFQLLKGNKITFKNGTLDIAEDATFKSFAMVIQNYSDLTLDNVVVDGTNLSHSITRYTISNNFGDSVFKNGTRIISSGDNHFAFDVCYYISSTYADGVTVTIEDDSVEVDGKVEYARYSSAPFDDFIAKTALIVPSGYQDNLEISVTNNYSTDYDYEWTDAIDKEGYVKVSVSEPVQETSI